MQTIGVAHLLLKPTCMHPLFKPTLAIVIVLASLAAISYPKFHQNTTVQTSLPTIDTTTAAYKRAVKQKIQVAVLLDVSNSMDGLIEQAKAQLWNMVSVMGRAQCEGITPKIEIALYEYGRPSNPVKDGYVRQINEFTGDLDQVSKNLFALHTNGGEEYCGHVMYSSLKELKWDSVGSGYKVLFIAGNEDFYQGDISYSRACTEAKKMGVVVNTIYCGDRRQGISEHWNMGSECGNGSFTNIDQDAKIDDIPTPYDDALLRLNEQLNSTYITYGKEGTKNFSKQKEVDQLNYQFNKSSAMKRVEIKSKGKIYKNSTWDVVDGIADDKEIIDKIDIKSLPDSLQHKSKQELKDFVEIKSRARTALQQQIGEISTKRNTWLIAEKAKAHTAGAATLESEIEKIIKDQAQKYGMTIR